MSAYLWLILPSVTKNIFIRKVKKNEKTMASDKYICYEYVMYQCNLQHSNVTQNYLCYS